MSMLSDLMTVQTMWSHHNSSITDANTDSDRDSSGDGDGDYVVLFGI